ncbi:hypothetical protein N7509_010701 [Penicillium cosmopolitanum]|uniref:Uncharacterized protein n=1 Tax=Penicillium cosmopolitanum TaxID=1131564 RepID=A0A9X0B4V1_9EURO|nr:uncharacterized protein N7509_010701 [Penicillium cosmopolitanum]KAJ5388160.1 hypothetical protein N7509_010701 [Penicillium cosmopolitanum]
MFISSITLAALGLIGSASALATRDAPDVNEEFGLYAYGDSIGGLSLFYAEVTRASASSSSSWIANPNVTTTNANYSWSDEMLYVPSSSSSSHEMGFTSKKMTNETTTGFIFYGQWVMVENDSGDISSSFYIRSSSAGEGIYSLVWNVTDDDTVIPISLRSAKPSNA